MKVSLKYTLQGHKAAIYKLIPGPERDTFYSCGGEGYLVEWSCHKESTGKLVARDNDSIYTMCLQPPGHILLGTKGGMLLSAGIQGTSPPRKIDLHKKGIYGICISGDSLLTVGGDGWMHVLDIEHLRLKYSTQLSAKALRTVVFDKSGNEIIAAGTEGCIFRLNVSGFELVEAQRGFHDSSIFCLSINPSGNLLSAGRDAVLVMSQSSSVLPLQSVAAHMNTINDLALNLNRSLLATASRDRTVKIWNPDTLELFKVIDTFKFPAHTHSVNTVLWLDDETLVSAGDDRMIKVWKIEV